MIDNSDFLYNENQNKFDFKGFLFKTFGYWKWFVVCWIVAFIIAYNVNIRKEKVYELKTTIAIKEESNPFFTSTTSLVFNWGGTSDQVQNVASTIKSRSHNERVVNKLDFFIDYLYKDKYYLRDVYGQIPFKVEIDRTKEQLLHNLFKVELLSEDEYRLSVIIEDETSKLINYDSNLITQLDIPDQLFSKKYKFEEQVNLGYANFKLKKINNLLPIKSKEFYFKFNVFDEVVLRYRDITTTIDTKSPSIIELGLEGTNKHRIVSFLNETVNTLIKTQLERKNQFATNTINFIDSTLKSMEKELKENEDEVKNFSRNKNIFQLENGGQQLSSKLLEYDVQKDIVLRKIAYYNSLKNYLTKIVDYSKLPAPSVAGIDDANIVMNVSKLINLSAERASKPYTVKNSKIFNDVDNEISALKNVILENIVSAKMSLEIDLNLINKKIYEAEALISKLPEDQQEHIKVMRKYDLNNEIFTSFLAKRNEANIVKAANLADIHYIDPAKDIGKGQIGPNTKVNYVIAFLLGLILPLIAIFTIFFLENTILNVDDISRLTTLPVIGIVGVKQNRSNLTVFEKPKSTLAESFRAIRSSLQFMYKKSNIEGAKTLMLTSSISGEGKTFCSINIATVFAMSDKKTVIVGLDLRKPKIFDDFKIKNDIGVVNYLVGQKKLDEVVQNTHIPYLDVITSGPIPPNPSELIIGDTMNEFMRILKERYDYIILDTPPIGLVADAIELAPHVDATLYIMRQNYTKKDMVSLLNNRHQREEIKNVSIVFNGFENRAKYGTGYGYGYGYG